MRFPGGLNREYLILHADGWYSCSRRPVPVFPGIGTPVPDRLGTGFPVSLMTHPDLQDASLPYQLNRQTLFSQACRIVGYRWKVHAGTAGRQCPCRIAVAPERCFRSPSSYVPWPAFAGSRLLCRLLLRLAGAYVLQAVLYRKGMVMQERLALCVLTFFTFNLLIIRKIFVTLHTDYGLGYP